MKIPAHAKYQIIYDTLQKNDNLLNVAAMCEIAGVSRSGYYHYLSTEDQRMEREERDRQDFLLILKAYQYRGYHKGARSISEYASFAYCSSSSGRIGRVPKYVK